MPTINKTTNYEKQPKYKHEARQCSLKYYNSKGWRKLREAIMISHPLCYACSLRGITRPATDVHHIVPFQTGVTEEERWKLLLDLDNCVPLCESCHHGIHNKNRTPNINLNSKIIV